MNKKKWMRKIVISSLLGVMGVSLAGCGEAGKVENQNTADKTDTSQETTEEMGQPVKEGEEPVYTAVKLTKAVTAETGGTEPDELFIEGTASFSIKLFQKVAAGVEKNVNYMISPTSIQMALAMAANGADKDTRRELERLLCGEIYEEGDFIKCGTVNMNIETLNQYLNAYVKQLADNDGVVFENANSIWMHSNKEKLQVKDAFLERVAGFEAECFQAPFDTSTVKDINDWVNYHTREMIPKLLNEIPEEAVMYLINAIAFEGQWEKAFEDYQMDEAFVFHSADGTEQTVTGMRSEEGTYLEGENATGFVKYYEGGRFGFAALLPKEDMTPEEFISQLNPEAFTELFSNKTYETVNIGMPKFRSDYDTELSEVLKVLGVKLAFTPEADFSQMAATDTGLLYINRVLHKTHIEVDEKGTKAAAVTSIEMTNGACLEQEEPKSVILDRPFVYAIMDMETNLPIFIGVQNSIK